MSDTKKSAGGAATPSADKGNNSTSIIEQAKAKIKVSDEKKLGQHEKAVNTAVAAALCTFCEQSEEFSRAVVESGKSYDDCLTAICRGLGRSISDFDLYTRAVQFWFPGAVIEYSMTIRMSEYELEGNAPDTQPGRRSGSVGARGEKAEPFTKAETRDRPLPPGDISLSLDSLLDW